MPSTTLTSRVRPGSGVTVETATRDSKQQQSSQPISTKATPGDREYVLDSEARENHGAYEPRGRRKDVTEAESSAARQCTMQSGLPRLPLPTPMVPTTEAMKALISLPIRRAWRSRSDLASPDVSQALILEAVMLHERGETQTPDQQCSKCRKGEGLAPECVKISGIYNGACSNCLLARASSRPGSVTRPIRSYSAERRFISATISPSIPKEDLIAVWNLIAGVIATQPKKCFLEDGSEPPGKRIEDAARLVARSADEWGHTVKDEGLEPVKTSKTPAERKKLVRQASRIRETALQIANCAKDWGEKLERKRSSSQLRK
ncbi:hypothetical protein CT0861_02720 [Colletotrichum tofieldiae]|uniref:Uncharacterized protein n=1 Tax=Colletotrichum tofieldiae TaxID=708197 RepID=A0A166YK55_9PEZI|nr:hypothetical protein CT0861_02720 [Colletotrichum tofieldiae]